MVKEKRKFEVTLSSELVGVPYVSPSLSSHVAFTFRGCCGQGVLHSFSSVMLCAITWPVNLRDASSRVLYQSRTGPSFG
jgi:hypothetical protein